MVSGTIETMGTMLAGQTADAFCASIMHADLLSIGLNCGTGPEFMTDHLRTISDMAPVRVSCYPNAGLPNEEGKYLETPTTVAAQLERFIDNGWLNIVGGCCGTTDAHIRAIAQMAEGKRPRPRAGPAHRAYYSGIELVEAEESNRPLIVGERTNVIGSRLFKNMVAEEKWEEATEIARWQVKNGAHIVDVCLQSTDRDEIGRHPAVLRQADPQDQSADHDRHHRSRGGGAGAHLVPGQEHHQLHQPGGRRGEIRAHLPHRQTLRRGAGGGLHRRRQGAGAGLHARAQAGRGASAPTGCSPKSTAFAPEDIIIDPLVFPCATGDANYIGAAVETIEGIRLVKENLPLRQDRAGHFQHLVRPAGGGARSGQLGLPVLLHQGGAGPGHRQRREAGALRFDSRRRAAPGREPAVQLRRRWMPTDEALRTAPEDWREQTPEQKAAINQLHIAAITEHFRKAGKRTKRAPKICRSTSAWPTTSSKAPRTA